MSCAALDYVECDTKLMDDAVLVGSGWVVEWRGVGVGKACWLQAFP